MIMCIILHRQTNIAKSKDDIYKMNKRKLIAQLHIMLYAETKRKKFRAIINNKYYFLSRLEKNKNYNFYENI